MIFSNLISLLAFLPDTELCPCSCLLFRRRSHGRRHNRHTLTEGIQLRYEDLQKELLRKVEGGKDYNAITDEMVRLQEMKKQSTVDNHHREEAMNRIKELQDFVTMQNTEIHVFDEALVRKLIKSIMVYADKFTVEFKSGISVDIAE